MDQTGRAKIIDYNGTGNKSFFVYLDEDVTFSSGEAVVGNKQIQVLQQHQMLQ